MKNYFDFKKTEYILITKFEILQNKTGNNETELQWNMYTVDMLTSIRKDGFETGRH